MNIYLLWYIGIGGIISAYSLWLILWKDAMETRPKKRKPINLEKITLGNLLLFILSFLGCAALWPIMALMAAGMTWDVYKLGKIVVYQKKEPTVKDLEQKASKLGFKLAPKELNLEGIEDVPDRQDI